MKRLPGIGVVIILCFSVLYFVYRIILPTEIVGVYDNHWVVVKHLPFYERAKIKWWKENRVVIKNNFNFPANHKGTFSFIILNHGDGFKKEESKQGDIFPSVDTSYLVCFDEIKSEFRCLNKNNGGLEVTKRKDGRVVYNEY